MKLNLTRQPPAHGACEVTWTVEAVRGHIVENGVNITTGVVVFPADVTSASFNVLLSSDDIPEVKEEYKVVLSNPVSTGKLSVNVTRSGAINLKRYAVVQL